MIFIMRDIFPPTDDVQGDTDDSWVVGGGKYVLLVTNILGLFNFLILAYLNKEVKLGKIVVIWTIDSKSSYSM